MRHPVINEQTAIEPEADTAGGHDGEFIGIVILGLQRTAPARDKISRGYERIRRAGAEIKFHDFIGAVDGGRAGERSVTVRVRPVLPQQAAASADSRRVHESSGRHTAVDSAGFYGDG